MSTRFMSDDTQIVILRPDHQFRSGLRSDLFDMMKKAGSVGGYRFLREKNGYHGRTGGYLGSFAKQGFIRLDEPPKIEQSVRLLLADALERVAAELRATVH